MLIGYKYEALCRECQSFTCKNTSRLHETMAANVDVEKGVQPQEAKNDSCPMFYSVCIVVACIAIVCLIVVINGVGNKAH